MESRVTTEPGSLDERGPRLVIESRARVEPVAQALCVVEGERDEGGGDVARDAGENEADRLELARGLVGGTEGKDRMLGQVRIGRSWESPGKRRDRPCIGEGGGRTRGRPATRRPRAGGTERRRRLRPRPRPRPRRAASGRAGVRTPPHGARNTRVRHETISVVHPRRFSDGRSVSAGPSTSIRSAPIACRRASRQPLASAKAVPQSRTALQTSSAVRPTSPPSPKASARVGGEGVHPHAVGGRPRRASYTKTASRDSGTSESARTVSTPCS